MQSEYIMAGGRVRSISTLVHDDRACLEVLLQRNVLLIS